MPPSLLSPACIPTAEKSAPRSAEEQGFEDLRFVFIQHLGLRNLSPLTIGQNEQSIRLFVAWLKEEGISSAHRVCKDTMERYKAYLMKHLNRKGQPLTGKTVNERVGIIQRWFAFLKKKGLMVANGYKTELVGKSRWDAKDPDGKYRVLDPCDKDRFERFER